MLTVIIVSWNVRDLLRECLTSLIEDLRSLEMPLQSNEKNADPGGLSQAHIVVVDSASSDGTSGMVRAEFSQVELIACTENIGYVKGNNLALRRIENAELRIEKTALNSQFFPSAALQGCAAILNSQFVWLLNPDTLVHPGATKALLDFMQAHPRCGLCGPKLVNADGSLQHGAFALPGLVQLALETQPLLWRFRNTRLDGRYAPAQFDGPPFQIGHPLGAALFARTEASRQVGLLDEGYGMYSEEIDWAMRMRRAGWEVWCVPQAVVTHYGGASSGQARERAERLKWQSRQRYYAKFYSPLKRWLAMRLMPAQYRSPQK